MQPTLLFQILASVTLISAAPTTGQLQSPNELTKRADIFSVDCGGVDFDRRAVMTAFNTLVAEANKPNNQKPAAGTRAYPQQYGNNQGIPSDGHVVSALNNIPGCQTAQPGYKYFEYPLANPNWTGGPQGSQGPHRVIAIAQNVGQGQTRRYTYCTAITHLGGSGPNDPSFRACTRT